LNDLDDKSLMIDIENKGLISESEIKRRNSNELSPKLKKRGKGRQSPISSSVKSSPLVSNKLLKMTQINEADVEPINENEFEN
jgi:hypothetical protein